ncbi:MAG TPA: hypothetical protein VHJ38_11375 [Nitrososphaeraceae archaeon]|jgi:hypothetical protein|nr:hypothetical protein [Nitrososphaeraceae archaeon]
MEIDYYPLNGFFESQTWGALHKCWIGFVIAKEKMEWYNRNLCQKDTTLGKRSGNRNNRFF